MWGKKESTSSDANAPDSPYNLSTMERDLRWVWDENEEERGQELGEEGESGGEWVGGWPTQAPKAHLTAQDPTATVLGGRVRRRTATDFGGSHSSYVALPLR